MVYLILGFRHFETQLQGVQVFPTAKSTMYASKKCGHEVMSIFHGTIKICKSVNKTVGVTNHTFKPSFSKIACDTSEVQNIPLQAKMIC